MERGVDRQHPSTSALAHAEEVCRERRLRFTPMRRKLFEELVRARKPLTAYGLLERVNDTRRIAPITIYRALDFLIEAGLVHRIATRNSYLPCERDHHGEAIVFLVCTRCGVVTETASAEVDRGLIGTTASLGFQLRTRTVEVEGECSDCLSHH